MVPVPVLGMYCAAVPVQVLVLVQYWQVIQCRSVVVRPPYVTRGSYIVCCWLITTGDDYWYGYKYLVTVVLTLYRQLYSTTSSRATTVL